jgi:hypothetical protein
MARKHKKGANKYLSQEYWDKLLLDYNLTMERGRNEKVHYVGDSSTLERVAGEHQTRTGRVVPKDPHE